MEIFNAEEWKYKRKKIDAKSESETEKVNDWDWVRKNEWKQAKILNKVITF